MKFKRVHLILTLLLPVWFGLVQFLSKHPQWIEKYYSNGIYIYISKFTRLLFGWIPFSLGDILWTLLFITLTIGFISLIKNRFKNTLSILLKLTSLLSVIYFLFYFMWGLNYFRESLAKNLGYKQSKYTTEELLNTTKHIINNINSMQLKLTGSDTLVVKNPYNQKEMYSLATNGYDNLITEFPQLAYQYKSVKSSMYSLPQTYNRTAGYFNPFTGEAQVNYLIPKNGFPSTTCHEMAHQIGYAAENEANFVGFLAASYNDDQYFKYSAYRMALSYCISEVRKRDKYAYKEIWELMYKGIKKDFRNSYLFWKNYNNPIEPYVKRGYNSFLKANQQDKGIDSYDYVVDLLISYYKTKQ